MNTSGDEAPVAGKDLQRKRKSGEVEPKPRTSGFIDLALAPDKFGALRGPEDERPSVYRRVETTVASSTGSCAPVEHSIQGGGRRCQGTEAATPYDSSSAWSKYIGLKLESEESSRPSSSTGSGDPSSHSSTPISCTLHERTAASSGGPTLRHFFALPDQHNVDDSTRVEPELPQNEPAVAHHDESEQGFNAGSSPTALSRIYSIQGCTRTAVPIPGSTRPTRVRFNIEGSATEVAPGSPARSSLNQPELTRDDLPRSPPMAQAEGSDDARHSRHSTDQYPARINYRFASAGLEASLLQRMEEQQREQDEADGEEQICSHVISPEDLIWGSVKHYCGMVLDRETRALLGTAILFVPSDHNINLESTRQGFPKSAWVTCVKVVEGRTEVLIKNSKGNIHVAQLMLTSTGLGLALFSVHVWQGTFALAFLSRVAGPAGLPHRLFKDVHRSDRVYVIGYEEPWESEAGAIADVRVRPGKIVDAGRHAIVEIDFATGQLGGSINSPAGFRGGLVVRADGLLAGVVTGEVLGSHPTKIDFSPAFSIYSLLEEL